MEWESGSWAPCLFLPWGWASRTAWEPPDPEKAQDGAPAPLVWCLGTAANACFAPSLSSGTATKTQLSPLLRWQAQCAGKWGLHTDQARPPGRKPTGRRGQRLYPQGEVNSSPLCISATWAHIHSLEPKCLSHQTHLCQLWGALVLVYVWGISRPCTLSGVHQKNSENMWV